MSDISSVSFSEQLQELQAAIAHNGFDGWLLYDFQGLNPHVRRVLALSEAFLTRRFFVYIPREGSPEVLHHRIEGGNWHTLTEGWGTEDRVVLREFSTSHELAVLLQRYAGQTLAMEYSPIPAIGRVDAATLEMVRDAGITVVSSANLLQASLVWSAEDRAAHLRAVEVLMEAKDAAFCLIHERLQAQEPVTEYEVQQLIMSRIHAAGMQAGHDVNVSFGVNAADSHYEPTALRSATLQQGQCVLIDLWAQEKGRPFADTTWVGFAADSLPVQYAAAWEAVKRARDEALKALQKDFSSGLEGWQIDRVAREAMGEWAAYFVHRTGHDLGVNIHGPGANLDSYEIHDTRRLTRGLCVTIEPGTYPAHLGFGIRSEIDVYLGKESLELTTPMQAQPFLLGNSESWMTVRAAGYSK